MQPPAITHTIASAAGMTRRRPPRARGPTWGLAPGRVAGLDGRNNLTPLEPHRRLRHDPFVALQSSLDVACGREVTADHHRLKARSVSRRHERGLGALRVEDD